MTQTDKKITVLQIRNEKTMKSLNIEIGVEDIERFKDFIGNSDFKYTYEDFDSGSNSAKNLMV